MRLRRIIILFLVVCGCFSVCSFADITTSTFVNRDLVVRSMSDAEYTDLSKDVNQLTSMNKSQQVKIKKLTSKDKKVQRNIKKLKKKIKKTHKAKLKKKYKKQLSVLKKNHKKYTKELKLLKEKNNTVQKKLKVSRAKLNNVKTAKPFIRISGKVGDTFLNNLVNYKVFPKGSIKNVIVASGEIPSDGEVGEIRGRKTVVNYVKENSSWNDEVYAINGQAWGGPWATPESTYDATNKVWSVPKNETFGGWKYSIPNPIYEQELATNGSASKNIGSLSYYNKQYIGFRVSLSGIMKQGDKITRGTSTASHKTWLAFKSDGSFQYGSVDKEQIPSEYIAAVSGHKILDNGVFVESTWASGGPKTFIGTKENGDVVIVTTVGRLPNFWSFSPKEHYDILTYLGCNNALCLDGGGSTSMVYKFAGSDKVVNIAECEGKITTRPVVNAVLFYTK